MMIMMIEMNTHILSHVGKYLLLDLTLSKLFLESGLGRSIEHLLPGISMVRTPREEEPAKTTPRRISFVEPDDGGEAHNGGGGDDDHDGYYL